MQRILCIHSSADLYGSDRSLLNTAKYIDKNKFELFILLPTNGPLVAELKNISNVKVEICKLAILRRKNLNIKGIYRFTRDFFTCCSLLRKYIIKNKIDMVYTNTSAAICGAMVARRMHIKNVWHIREIMQRKIENAFISHLIRVYSNLVIVNSKTTGDFLIVPPEKIRVVYNGIEANDVDLSNIFNHEVFTVGMAGRINRWKGQELFIDAAKIVVKNNSNVIFKIAGSAYDGEEYMQDKIKSYINKKGMNKNVILMGQVDDMDSFYKSLDVYVLPSVKPEPFGLVIIEAMQYGIPVIATNHGGPTEIIKNRIDGYLVDYSDANEMASIIEKFINDSKLKRKIGNKGKIKQKNNFTVEKTVKNIELVFEELANLK